MSAHILPPDLVEVPEEHRTAAKRLREAVFFLSGAASLVNQRSFRDRLALLVGEVEQLRNEIDPQCAKCEDGGVRCERRANHPPPCACPRAAARTNGGGRSR